MLINKSEESQNYNGENERGHNIPFQETNCETEAFSCPFSGNFCKPWNPKLTNP